MKKAYKVAPELRQQFIDRIKNIIRTYDEMSGLVEEVTYFEFDDRVRRGQLGGNDPTWEAYGDCPKQRYKHKDNIPLPSKLKLSGGK